MIPLGLSITTLTPLGTRELFETAMKFFDLPANIVFIFGNKTDRFIL